MSILRQHPQYLPRVTPREPSGHDLAAAVAHDDDVRKQQAFAYPHTRDVGPGNHHSSVTHQSALVIRHIGGVYLDLVGKQDVALG